MFTSRWNEGTSPTMRETRGFAREVVLELRSGGEEELT